MIPPSGTEGPLRIEMVLPSLIPAGMELLTVALARALQVRGHDVGIVCIDEEGPLASSVRQGGIPVQLVQMPGKLPNLFPQRLANALRARRPHAVHIHSGAWLKGARAARAGGVRHVIHTVHGMHDDDRFGVRMAMRLGAMHTDAIVAVSESMREYLVNCLHITPRKTLVVINGVDTEAFGPGPPTGTLRRRFDLGSRPVIGIVARFHPVKDHLTAIRACSAATS